MPLFHVSVQGSVETGSAASAEEAMATRGTWDEPPFFTKVQTKPGTFFLATTQITAATEDEATASVRAVLEPLPGLIELEVLAL